MSEDTASQEVVEMSEVEFESILTKDRKRVMNQRIAEIENRIKHLKKIRRKWALADNIIKTLGITFTCLLTIITAIINVTPGINQNALQVMTAVFSSLAAVTAVSSEGTILGFTGKNKTKFIKQIRQQELKLNRSYIFYEKARSDATISNEELEQFMKILED